MTYFWTQAIALRMSVEEDGTPHAFVWERQRHLVSGIADQWRIDEEWWLISRIWREYYKLYTDTGLLVEVYQNLLTGQWFLQSLFD